MRLMSWMHRSLLHPEAESPNFIPKSSTLNSCSLLIKCPYVPSESVLQSSISPADSLWSLVTLLPDLQVNEASSSVSVLLNLSFYMKEGENYS